MSLSLHDLGVDGYEARLLRVCRPLVMATTQNSSWALSILSSDFTRRTWGLKIRQNRTCTPDCGASDFYEIHDCYQAYQPMG